MRLLVTDDATHDFTIPGFAEQTQTSERHVRSLIARGDLRAYKLGRAVRIPREELYRLHGVRPR
jgi:excisionase family DNA binding protein